MTMVRLRRFPQPVGDEWRTYRVVLDGRLVGRIASREIFEIDTEPGRHVLELRIDWTGSRAIAFDLAATEVAEFECYPSGNLLTRIPRLFGRHGWIVLKRANQPESR
jgi:hypothetical protein